MPADTSEKGLESLIVASLTGRSGREVPGGAHTGEHAPAYNNGWYVQGDPRDRKVLNKLIWDTIKQFSDNDSFRRWLKDIVFGLTYEPPPPTLPNAR